MQNGSMIRTERHGGPDVWEFRWREPGPDGKRKHRRMVVGTTNEFGDEVAAREAIAGLHLCMNSRSERVKVRQITLSELVDHYRQRELKPDILWKTHSTKVTYDGYLNKWIMPRWGNYTLNRISAGEVELWSQFTNEELRVGCLIWLSCVCLFVPTRTAPDCLKRLAIVQTEPEIGDGVVPFCACAKSGRSP